MFGLLLWARPVGIKNGDHGLVVGVLPNAACKIPFPLPVSLYVLFLNVTKAA